MTYSFVLLPFLALIVFNLAPAKRRTELALWLSLVILLCQLAIAGLIFTGWRCQDLCLQLEIIMGFNLMVNNIIAVLLVSGSLAGLAALLVAWDSFPRPEEKFSFCNLLMISLIGLNGLAMTSDIFTLYIFIEIAALASFILIILRPEIKAREASFKYLVLSVVASTLMLSAIALLLIVAGGTSYFDIKRAMLASHSHLMTKAAIALFISGLFIKGGLVPFHAWLPDAYGAAPTAVSTLLAGIVTKASGIFPLIVLAPFVFGFDRQLSSVIMAVGALSIVIGALAALWQKELKRLLAYSSISQMGYIVLALGTGTNLGFVAALFHFFNHALFKAQLFANVAAVESQVGERPIDELGGLAQSMPVTGVTSVIASLSTAGLPPLSGFWSKLLIIMALWLSGHYAYALIAVLASVLTLAYFLYLQRKIFFGKLMPELSQVKEAGWLLLLPAVLLTLITIGVGLVFPFMVNGLMK